jgi:hypothetical protein
MLTYIFCRDCNPSLCFFSSMVFCRCRCFHCTTTHDESVGAFHWNYPSSSLSSVFVVADFFFLFSFCSCFLNKYKRRFFFFLVHAFSAYHARSRTDQARDRNPALMYLSGICLLLFLLLLLLVFVSVILWYRRPAPRQCYRSQWTHWFFFITCVSVFSRLLACVT